MTNHEFQKEVLKQLRKVNDKLGFFVLISILAILFNLLNACTGGLF